MACEHETHPAAVVKLHIFKRLPHARRRCTCVIGDVEDVSVKEGVSPDEVLNLIWQVSEIQKAGCRHGKDVLRSVEAVRVLSEEIFMTLLTLFGRAMAEKK